MNCLKEVLKLKVDRKSMLLYVVTDRSWLGQNRLEQQVEETIRGGATFMQLREKEMSFEDFAAEARKIKEVTDRYGIPLVINDDVQVALAVDADGIHVGQSDMACINVRELIGADKILGVSVQTVEQAILAEQQGADYLGVGAVFSTSPKNDADDVTRETLQAICKAVTIPVVAIGGIHEGNMRQLQGSGIDGVAVISAIFAKPDILAATKNLAAIAKEIF